ncbi:MAG: class 1 isoprenoid biosynthesis enzyme [Myxococcota bacterium]
MTALARDFGPIEFPDQFQGLFARARSRYEPIIHRARSSLRSLPVPSHFAPYFRYGVLEHPQPSFVLAPLMFLAVAEDQGGISPRHERYLPAFLLMVELIGVLDDTVDYTPLRSGRRTYWHRFGAPSAAPFSGFLLSAAVEQTMGAAPELLPLVTRMFREVGAAETWEHGARYPAANPGALATWLEHHYAAVPAAISHSLDGALLLHGHEPLPPQVCVRFAQLQQDVDDIVNLVERREQAGENDDLKMGVVTFPLLAAVRHDPRAAQWLDDLWRTGRRPDDGSPELPPAALPLTAPQHPALRALVLSHGVPATLDKIAHDAAAAIAATQPPMKNCMADLVWTFVERLCRIESLRREVERRCPAVMTVRGDGEGG